MQFACCWKLRHEVISGDISHSLEPEPGSGVVGFEATDLLDLIDEKQLVF